jgi:hypothetical protein
MKKLVVAFAVVMLFAVSVTVYANTYTGGGGDVPFYARIERGEILHDDEWAVIVFYRPPECVPDEFDLLDFYDWNAFGCIPHTTDGFIIWEGEPGYTPIQIKLRGLGAVPVWFVNWSDLEQEVGDGELLMSELEGMGKLSGTADIYSETLHPTGAAQVPMINYVAVGNLEDGTSFKVHALLVADKGDPSIDINTNVQITFK